MCPTSTLAGLIEALRGGLTIEIRLNPPTTAGTGSGTPRAGRSPNSLSPGAGSAIEAGAGLSDPPGPELEAALAEVRQAVRLANPAEGRSDDELNSEAVAYLEGQGRPVAPEEIRTLAGQVAEAIVGDPDTAKAAKAAERTLEIREAIGSSKWATAVFERVRPAAHVAGADAYAWVVDEGLDLTTKPGRDRARELIKAGIDWSAYVPREKLP